ncbi:chemosensory receptor A [Elysia marginata]|uniref:Chemosensory receptor A n=1 Tax=Elysia marginata TaxID=1093978 RepID=A0AAV4IXQ0_9GAST|nr:chemosensory receptor A [Elysia marginata]
MPDPLMMNMTNLTFHPSAAVTPLVSYALLNYFAVINLFVFVAPASLLGVFTNIANIIVYTKMGLSESSNVNFLVLSVFDLLYSVASLLMRLLYSPIFWSLSEAPVMMGVSHGLSHGMVVMTCGSAMMTALISTERCVCVVFPLKVKTLLSRQRSLCLMLTIVAYHVAFLLLLYIDTGPPYDLHPKKLSFYYLCLYSIPLVTCFFAVIVNTIFLVLRVKRNQRWRQTKALHNDKTSSKDDKLVRTIISISTMFIICSCPTVAIFFGQVSYPRLRHSDPYFGNFTLLMFAVSGIFNGVSASGNIIFYYRMSSRNGGGGRGSGGGGGGDGHDDDDTQDDDDSDDDGYE